MALLNCSVPPLTVVPPAKVLAAVRMTVPVPLSVSPAVFAPVMMPVTVKGCVPLTAQVCGPPSVSGAVTVCGAWPLSVMPPPMVNVPPPELMTTG